MKFFTILSFHLLLAHACFSQHTYYTNYDVDNGLNSNEVYDVMEDRKGFIWIATDKGICKYNGYEFEKITVKDGLPDNTIFGFQEDYQGRIWLRSMNGQLAYIKDDTIKLILPGKLFGHIFSLYADRFDTVWFSTKLSQYKVFLKNGKFMFKELPNYVVRKIDETKRGVITGIPSTNYMNYSFINGVVNPVDFSELNNRDIRFSTHAYNMGKDEVWVDGGSLLFSYMSDSVSILAESSEGHSELCVMDDGEIFIGGVDGIQKLTNNRTLDPRFLKGNDISAIIQDREGGYWVGTLNNGVFHSANLTIKTYRLTTENKIAAFIKGEKQRLFAITKFGNVYEKETSGFKKIYTSNSKALEFRWAELNELGKIEIYMDKYIIRMNNEWSKKERIGAIRYPFIGDYLFYFMSGHQVALSRKDTDIPFYTARIPDKLKYAKLLFHQNVYYIPTMRGLYSIDPLNKLVNYGEKYTALQQRINSIAIDNQQRKWITTNGEGIYLLDNNELVHLNRFNASIGNICRSIICDDKYVWAAGEKGLIRIDLADYRKVEVYTHKDGLLSNNITCIYSDSNEVFLGHTSGITQFPKTYKRKSIPPVIYITGVDVNHASKTIDTNYDLTYDEGLIQVNYTGVSYNFGLKYKYRLKNKSDTNWTYTNERGVQFISLPPGAHTFEVYAINSIGIESETPARITFTVSPPFWKTWWFLLIASLLLVSGVTLFIKLRLKKLRLAVSTERKLIDIEQQALRARMNPHFIFNSLNSVQSYMLENDKRSANKYLSSFSKLIRLILDNSDKKLISIEKELEVLESYMYLESLRFKEKVNYEIDIANHLRLEKYKIPPLLLQPYVENAIRHGIMHKESEGSVKVRISDLGNCILCLIEDNGVGREKAREIKNRKTTSYPSSGMKITANRIDLMQELFGKDFSVKIIDLKSKSEAMGTQVEIRIPYLT